MAAPKSGSCRRQLLMVWLCLLCHLGLSQVTAQVVPPGGSAKATYASDVDNSLTSTVRTPTPTPAPAPAPTGAPTARGAGCSLEAVHPVRDKLEGMLISGAKLIEVELILLHHPADYLQHHLKGVYDPTHWVRSTGRQGRSLLVLEDNYDFMSLFFLSIGVHQLQVTIRDSPRDCLLGLRPEETLQTIRQLLLNDFKRQESGGQTGGSLSVDEHVCHMVIKNEDSYAAFRYVCCHLSPDGDVICDEVTTDQWIDVLMAIIVITKVMVVLFSPSFLPGSLYRLKYVAAEYIYRIPDVSPVKRIKLVVTQYPQSYGNDEKVVKLSEVKGMEYFKTMVDTNMQLDKIYNVTFDRVRLSVKTRRLLGENYVPVGLFRVLYNNLLRCRIRRLSPLQECCETNLLGRLNPGVSCPTWLTLCKALAKLLLLFLLTLPWIIRAWVYFTFEDVTVKKKMAAAEAVGLKTSFRGSLTLYLTPLHFVFVLIYVILVIDSVVYGVLSKGMKEKFKLVLRKCLRDMRERSRITVCAWSTWLLVLPMRMLGVVGVLLFLPYLLLVLPVALPVAAFYLFPALNLSVRLIIHFFLFLCPAKLTERWERFSAKFIRVREQLDLHKVTADENFHSSHKLGKRDVLMQVVIIFMVLVSFWSLTFLLMEVVSFLVEVAVYTLMGIIVNAGSLLQYITVGFLVVMYGRTSFNDVHNTYLAYHRQIHAMLLEMKRQEINTIARQEALDQENTALRVQGNMAPPAQDRDVRVVVKRGQPLWRTSSVLMFLDRQDTPYLPEKFFYDTILLNYCGAPGPLYKHFLAAMWGFSKILLFLFFVFVVVMAFGDAYSVSSTNQLLATVAGGFIPFLFRYVFAAAGGVPSLCTDSVQFLTQLHLAINRYQQNWPIYDIIPIEFGEANVRDSVVMNSTSLTQPPAPGNHHHTPDTSRVDGEGEVKVEMEGEEEGEEEEVEEEGGVDMIIDVSTAESRRRGHLGLREAGSASMLAPDSFNRGARIYLPPPQERAIDV